MKSDINRKFKMHTLLSVLTTVIGIVLLIFMITVESEPGAIPLLLIATGASWYFITRHKIRSQYN